MNQTEPLECHVGHELLMHQRYWWFSLSFPMKHEFIRYLLIPKILNELLVWSQNPILFRHLLKFHDKRERILSPFFLSHLFKKRRRVTAVFISTNLHFHI